MIVVCSVPGKSSSVGPSNIEFIKLIYVLYGPIHYAIIGAAADAVIQKIQTPWQRKQQMAMH